MSRQNTMRYPCVVGLLAAGVCALPLAAQQKVELTNTYERLYCVVPIVAGNKSEPRRPMYAPVPGQPAGRSGILAFVSTTSDDGRFALVEYVAADRAAFEPIFSDNRSDVKCFAKGKARKADIESEFRKYKKDFSFERFAVRVP